MSNSVQALSEALTVSPKEAMQRSGRWYEASSAALATMQAGGNPAETESKWTPYVGMSVNQFLYLKKTTEFLSVAAGDLFSRFQARRFWEFIEAVQLWCEGSRSRRDFLSAENLLSEARTENARLINAMQKELTASASATESMDRYFVEETAKPKHVSGTNQQILDRAIKHPNWPCPGSLQGMRKRVDKYRKEHDMGPRPPRNHKSR